MSIITKEDWDEAVQAVERQARQVKPEEGDTPWGQGFYLGFYLGFCLGWKEGADFAIKELARQFGYPEMF